MTSIRITNITPEKWSELLTRAAPNNAYKIKKYLAVGNPQNSQDMSEYCIELLTAKEIKEKKYQKLNLREISYLSRRILERTEYASGKEGVIAERISQLAQAKIDRPVKNAQGVRKLLHAFTTLLSSLFGTSINQIKIAKKMAAYIQKKADSQKEDYFVTVNKAIKIENEDYDKNIIEQNFQLALKKSYYVSITDNSDNDSIRKQYVDLPEILAIFATDNERSLFDIVINDKSTVYKTMKKPHESLDVAPEELEKFIRNLFNKLKSTAEGSDSWLSLLQIVFTQTTQNQLYADIAGKCFTSNAPEKLSSGEGYYQLINNNNEPTRIEVTVLRNNSEKIEKILVTAETKSDFHQIDMISGKNEKVSGKGIKSTLHYEIFLNSQSKPEFKVTHYHHEMV